MSWKNGQTIDTADDMADYIAAGNPSHDLDGNVAVDLATCGTCGRTWDDSRITGVTPAPSGRCPFEYWHSES
jgi:hypothetical protein